MASFETRPPARAASLLLLAAAIFFVPCRAPASTPEPLILISIDGFRWDYLHLYDTPNLSALARRGAHAQALVPVFPSKTFPNHYSAVTGLYPQHHGIVANAMHDSELGRFAIGDRKAVEDGRWWGGEPIWVTAEKQGIRAATCFWPGSEGEIGGVRPTYWRRYDTSFPDDERVDLIFEWLDLPVEQRPGLLTLYFSLVDSAGHDRGPGDPATAAAVREVDRLIGRLVAGLRERDLYERSHLVVISDHGMAETPPGQTVFLGDYVDLEGIVISGGTPTVFLDPPPARVDEIFEALQGAHPRLQVMRREQTPVSWHFRDHPRIPALIAVTDEGWNLRASRLEGRPARGMHGYDPRLPSMHGILITHGPRVATGVSIAQVGMVDLYNFMCRLLGLEPAPNDGDPAAVRPLLAGN
jgi:predicted AlkP superfamily pyrophosphatase or phosphodiesterase